MVHVRSAASIGELKMKEWNTLYPKSYYRALTKCHIFLQKSRELFTGYDRNNCEDIWIEIVTVEEGAEWRNQRELPANQLKYCKAIRNEIADYYSKDGAVALQQDTLA